MNVPISDAAGNRDFFPQVFKKIRLSLDRKLTEFDKKLDNLDAAKLHINQDPSVLIVVTVLVLISTVTLCDTTDNRDWEKNMKASTVWIKMSTGSGFL